MLDPADRASNRTASSAIQQVAKTVKKANVGRRVARTVSGRSGRGSISSGRRSSYSGSSGGGSSRRQSGGGGGGGGGGFSAPKAPVPPSIASYLGTDSVYQQALTGGKRTLADYLSELGRRRGEAGTQYNQTLGTMERDRTQQLEDLKNEFASRGLINSGLYGEEQGKFQKQFMDQLNTLKMQQSGLLADLLSQQKNYQREYDLAIQQAKQEALARRAAKYNIGG